MPPSDRPILIVDDPSYVREVARVALEPEGYRVVAARDGAEAMRLLREGLRPCLILLDLIMPGMDGNSFRRPQAKDPELAAIPTIIYSASPAASRVAAETGAAASASKEDLSELLETIATPCLRGPA